MCYETVKSNVQGRGVFLYDIFSCEKKGLYFSEKAVLLLFKIVVDGEFIFCWVVSQLLYCYSLLEDEICSLFRYTLNKIFIKLYLLLHLK